MKLVFVYIFYGQCIFKVARVLFHIVLSLPVSLSVFLSLKNIRLSLLKKTCYVFFCKILVTVNR
jgi:hypothetical protein